jgi:hypothetical protein
VSQAMGLGTKNRQKQQNARRSQVKSPEDRLALEKEIPSLIAARDKAVTAAKRKQLEKEMAQTTNHVAKREGRGQ